MPLHFEPPLIVSLDEEFIDGEMASMYVDPAVIVRKDLFAELQRLGVGNIEVFPVIIKDDVHGTQNAEDYLFINILGTVSWAALVRSDQVEVSLEALPMNESDVDAGHISDLDLCLLHEDTDCIIVSQRIRDGLCSLGFDDLYFEEICLS